MKVERDVQPGLFADSKERPVGPILPSVFAGSNADLMAAVAPLYLTGSVLDVTYGEGRWWTRFTPEPFTFHDKFKVDGVDFTVLPEDDASFDTVCFNPPYVISGGIGSSTAGDFLDNYGIGDRDPVSFYLLIRCGLAECLRVANGFVLVKCMEFAQGGQFHDIPHLVTEQAKALGWVKHDQIVHHTGTGPGGHNIFTVKRARRAHSYLLVFVRRDGAKR